MSFKGLLDWISGRSAVPEVAKVSSAPERRRFARVGLEDCDILLGKKGPFPVTNISYGGVRITVPDPELRKELPAGAQVVGKIRLQAIQTRINLTVQNVFPDGVGCAFAELTPAQGRLFSDFIKPRILGSSMQEVLSSAVKNKDPDLKLRWFQGDEGTQIFLWQSLAGETVTQEYYFLNYVITWKKDQGLLRTGYVKDEAGKSGFGRIDPGSVVFFHVPSHRALTIGRTILENSTLPPEARDRLISSILAEERRLYSRYILKDTDQRIRFYTDAARTTFLTVANLSFRGIALVVEGVADDAAFAKGQTLAGEIAVLGNFVPAKVRIVFRRDQMVGGALEIEGEKNLEALAQFLAPRILGQSLEEAPTPMEELPYLPTGARCYLHLGLHNTHVLTVIRPGGALIMGRIVYMDQVLVFERQTLSAHRCPSGIIFPRDWELPAENLEREARVSDFSRYLALEMVSAGALSDEVRKAWREVLEPPAKPAK